MNKPNKFLLILCGIAFMVSFVVWSSSHQPANSHSVVLIEQNNCVIQSDLSSTHFQRINSTIAEIGNASVSENIVIREPFQSTVFPIDIRSPTFSWEPANTSNPNDSQWVILIDFDGKRKKFCDILSKSTWVPNPLVWNYIKQHSLNKLTKFTVIQIRKNSDVSILALGTIDFLTSPDPVEAPLFFREVALPFTRYFDVWEGSTNVRSLRPLLKNLDLIRYRFVDLTSYVDPPIVLEKLPMCSNCHSFSSDGRFMGLELDLNNSKGTYVVTDTAPEITLTRDMAIDWNNLGKKNSNEQTTYFGFMGRLSPDGEWLVSSAKDKLFLIAIPDLAYSQLTMPATGILGYYSRKDKTMKALPGADDENFVHANPSWSSDGKYIVFSRARVKDNLRQDTFDLYNKRPLEDLQKEFSIQYDLYRIPFNNGKGGQAEPIAGASANGRSNFFGKYSPNGKWIVFTQSASGMLIQPDSELFIIPSEGGIPRKLACNTERMNSYHNWSPNSRWLVFSSKAFSIYTDLLLSHIDEEGNCSPPVRLSWVKAEDRAANLPEFVNLPGDGIQKIIPNF